MRRRIVLVLLSIAVLAIGVLIVSPRPTQAATFTVTNLNNGGAGSLRGQLSLAADGDTIVFDTNLPDNSVILLTSPIGLGHSVTIDGAAVAGLKISGGGSVRVFGVNLLVTPTLRNLSVINGADTAGGCINANTINMVNVTISGCTSTVRGGGVFLWSGTSTLTNVTFTNNHADTDGGALMVANGATVTITNGTFSGNTAGADGGALAVDNGAVLTISNGSFSNNTATVGGGAIRNESIGAGGLPGLRVQNSSIHDNNAQGGGGISNGLGGILRITNTVIHANGAQWGGGISNDGANTALTIINSTISSNTATGNLGGGLNNYANASFTISGSFFDGNSTNTQGAAIYNENGSATISTTEFTNNTATYDGAAYYGNHATGTITSSTMDSNHGEDGAAILLYDNSSLTLDDVDITNNVATGWGGAIYALVTSSVTIQNGSLIDGNTATVGGGIALGATGTGTVTNSTISYNQANNGGGVYTQGALTVTTSTVDHNTASVGGGGIFHASASGTTITGSTLSNNGATNNGGALTNNGAGLVTITGSTITGNTSMFGAGVNVFDARTIEISGTTFSDNHATTGGGFSSSGTVTLTNVVFSANSASSVGGAFSTGPNATTNLTATDILANEANNGAGIHNRGDLTIDGGSISDNAGTGNGGAIYNWDAGVVSVNGATIAGNGAYGNGGAIFNAGSGSSITLNGVALTLNAADTNSNAFGAGGAIYNESGGAIMVQAGTVIGGAAGSGNYAVIGGGIFSTGTGSTLLIDDSMVTYNTAGNSGGLENLSGSAATITNSSVDHNTSSNFSGGYGGGVGGTLTASDSSFSYNTAASAGGGIVISSTASANLTNIMVVGNASAQGGGVWMDGTATISGSTIDGNTSTTIAGGLFVGAFGHQTLGSSTISNNTATTSGGGILVDGGGTLDISTTTVSTNGADAGGGLYNRISGTVIMTDSHFTGNTASDRGAGIVNDHSMTITGGTITDNSATDGGGIWNAGTLTLDQVVIQSNEVTHYGGGLYHTGGALTSQNGTQFIGNTSVLHGGGIYNSSTGTAANISGTTFTANIANVSGGSNADGGAYYGDGSTATLTASTLTDNQAEDGGAVLLFNNASLTLDNVDLVHNIASGNGGGILALSGAALHIQNGSLLDLNEAHTGAGLVVWAPATATVDASTIRRNKATFAGGGISSAGAVTITNSLIDNNDGGSLCGGGIIHYGTSQTLTLTNTIISNNTVVNNGGGICQQAASGLVLINGGSQITGNDADIGAGINAYDNTPVMIQDSTISGNTAHITGGGIGTGGTLTVTNSSIVNNQSADRSAGLRIAASGNVTLNSSHVDNNHADGSFAGGIGTVGTLTVNGGTIHNNQAKTDGGGVYTLGGSVTLNGVTVEGNHADSDSNASGNGGGLYISGGTIVNLTTGTVIGGAAAGQGNTAVNGGGIWNTGTLNSNQVLYRYNTASGNGGGLYLETGASGAVANSVFTNNTAAAGGGVYSDSGSAALINSTVYGNSSGLQFADSSTIRNVIAYGNTLDCTGSGNAQHTLIGTGTCATNGVNGSAVGFDPLFVDAVGGNFALNATSPAIDGGNSTFAAVYANDYVGAARVQGASVDMGAVESAFETTVSLTATDDVAAEAGGDDGTFQLTRTGNTSGELTVTLDVGGTADAADYDLTQGATSLTGTPISVTFPANTTTLDLTLTALQDLLLEGSETVVLTLQDGSNYNLTAQFTATVTIVDDDTFGIVVSQSSGSTDLAEAGASDSFTISLTSIPAQPVTITLTHDPVDFVAVGDPDGSIEIVLDAQALTGLVEFEAVNDALVEGLETGAITFAVASADANYNGLVIPPLPVNIVDNDDAAVSFETPAGNAPEAVSPYSVNAVLTITSDPVGGSLAEPLDVAIVEAAGSALTPDDYTLVTIVASFPAGALDQAATPVSVAIAGDSLAEGSETFTLSFGAVTGAGTASGSHAVTIIDDEGVGVNITPTGGLITTEAGGTTTFDVVLTSQPTADVTVSFTSGDTSEGTVTPALTFTPANWSSAQPVTVMGVDDSLDDGDIAYVIAVTVTSGDPGYNNLAVAGVSVTNTDDDTVGVNVNPTSGLVTTEAGGTANFSVVLTSQPLATVTISLLSSDTTEGTVPAAITFTPANWGSAQTITVTGVDDLVDDGDSAYTIQTTVTSSDAQYNGIAAADVSVTNTDDDTAGVTVNPMSGLVTTEAGGTATFSVVLSSRPMENVSVNLLSSDPTEGTVPAAITFTPANWNSTQNVTVTGVDDALVDGSIVYTIVTTVSSLDSVYNGIAAADVSVTNMDNDTAGVVVNPTGGLVTTEAGGTATFSVILTSQPTADVTVNLLSSDPTEGTVPAAITFTPANWNSAQTVTVAGVDDALADGNIGYTIQTTVTSGDAIYNGIAAADVGVTNVDDDTANVLISPTSGLVTTEAGGTATFNVVLSSQPAVDVTVNLLSSDPTEGTVPAAITFTPADWNSAQIVTVTGVDDLIDDGDSAYSIVTTVSSADATYNGIAVVDVSVTNTDDDTAGVTVNPTVGLVTTETGGTANFTVVLMSQPTGDVTVNLASSDPTEGTVPAAIIFTPANWNTAQTVTVTGVDDLIDDGDSAYSIITTVSSGDATYNGIAAADVSVTNVDDDTAGVTVNPTSGLVTTEAGGTASFTVVLTSQPTADVIVNLTSSDLSEGTVPVQITFTPANWNSAQTVTVTGVNDLIDDGDTAYTIITTVTSADNAYNGIAAADVSVTNIDDDTAGVTVNPTSGLVTTEAGGTATFTVVLNTQPGAAVTISLSSSDLSEGTVPAQITFPAANWNVAQTVTVTGVDDVIDDGDIAYTIITTVSSADAAYNGIAAADVSVTNTDDDAAGMTVNPTSGLVTTEAGGTASFALVLTSQPTADVTVSLISSDLSEGTVPAAITFTPANWNAAQTVTVTGVDDVIDDGDIGYTIITQVTSADGAYHGIAAADVSITNADDDTAGVNVNPTSGLVTTEAGGTATFAVALVTQPTADVTISLTSSDSTEGTIPTAITFTPANWNVAQTVTVTGVDDTVDDGDVAYSIVTGAAVSADPSYNGVDPADVNATNTDDETAGISITPTTLHMTENGAAQTYSITVDTTPSQPFTLAVVFDVAEVTVNGSSTSPLLLTFSNGGTVVMTVDVVEQAAVNTDRMTTIAHIITTNNTPEYPSSLALPAVTVLVSDAPPPPPVPTCEAHNFDAGGVVRSSAPDATSYAINCRILYQNGAPTSWLGNPLYSEANLGVAGLLDLGVEQAVDIFSPPGLTYFQDGAVFCLRGSGTLIWLAASGMPRHAEIIGSYTVDPFPGFTCATLFEPGTLVLVSENPLAR